MSLMPIDELVDLHGFARILGIEYNKLRNFRDRGQLPCFDSLGNNNSHLWKLSKVLAFKNRKSAPKTNRTHTSTARFSLRIFPQYLKVFRDLADMNHLRQGELFELMIEYIWYRREAFCEWAIHHGKNRSNF